MCVFCYKLSVFFFVCWLVGFCVCLAARLPGRKWWKCGPKKNSLHFGKNPRQGADRHIIFTLGNSLGRELHSLRALLVCLCCYFSQLDNWAIARLLFLCQWIYIACETSFFFLQSCLPIMVVILLMTCRSRPSETQNLTLVSHVTPWDSIQPPPLSPLII